MTPIFRFPLAQAQLLLGEHHRIGHLFKRLASNLIYRVEFEFRMPCRMQGISCLPAKLQILREAS